MKPSAILSGEHRVIEQVLDCLEKMAECVEAGSPLDTAAASKALDFFRNFADRCHHGKEESHFFPAMEQKGFVRDGGPTGVMLYEHELGRQRVAAMAQALASLKGGTAHAANGFAAAARAFALASSQYRSSTSSGRPPSTMKFSEMISNQSTVGFFPRMWS